MAERPSRTQLKREAEAIRELGTQLARLSPDALARLNLDDEIVEAVLTCSTLKKGSRVRQLRLVAKMLRARDHQAIRKAFEASRARSTRTES